MNYWNEIKEEINAYFPDNNNKEITASRLRTVFNDVVNNINIWYYGTEEINDQYYTKSYIDTNFYRKSEVDDIETTLVEDLGDTNGRITNLEDNLSAYYYTKNQIDDKTNIVVGVERKIGTWTEDGETYDLYEKIVNIGALPNADTLEVPHGITNKVRFVETSGFAYGNNNINIPFVNASGAMFIYMGVGNSKITITTNSDRSNMTGYVTLRYIRAIQ